MNEPQAVRWRGLVWLLAAALLIWIAYWVSLSVFLSLPEGSPWDSVYARRGQFGDMFGGVNALFSAFAFAGIIYAIYLQRVDLAIQGKILALTLQEVQTQSKAFNTQNKILSADLTYQVLVSILREYRSVEMGIAVRELWDFARANPGRLGEAYEERRAAESKVVQSLRLPHRLEGERMTLHFERRFVSHFYQTLAKLYGLGFVPPEILYSLWSEADLRIIPQVILPLENELGRVLGTGSPAIAVALKKLYDDSICYPHSKERPNEANGADAV